MPLLLFLSTGRGLFLQDSRPKGSFLVEYYGELIDAAEGYRREEQLGDHSVFRYFLQHRKKDWWYVSDYCMHFACVDVCL